VSALSAIIAVDASVNGLHTRLDLPQLWNQQRVSTSVDQYSYFNSFRIAITDHTSWLAAESFGSYFNEH